MPGEMIVESPDSISKTSSSSLADGSGDNIDEMKKFLADDEPKGQEDKEIEDIKDKIKAKPSPDKEELEETEEEPEEKKEKSLLEEFEESDDLDEETPEEEKIEKEAETSVFKKITSKFPKFFQEFPELREELGKAHQLVEIFPTIDDAKEASVKATNLDNAEVYLSKGESAPLLSAMFKANPEAANKFVKGFLPTLYKGSPDLYLEVTLPVVKDLANFLKTQGEETSNDNLKNSAYWINKLFSLDKVKDAPQVDPELQKERQKLETEKAGLFQQKYSSFTDSVYSSTFNVLEKRLANSLGDKIPERMKKTVVKEIMDDIGEQLKGDKAHTALMRSLWDKVRKGSMTDDLRTQIIRTYLKRVDPLLSATKAKIMKDYLIASENSETEEETPPKRIPPSGRVLTTKGKLPTDPKKINWNKTSDLDFLNGRAVLK